MHVLYFVFLDARMSTFQELCVAFRKLSICLLISVNNKQYPK